MTTSEHIEVTAFMMNLLWMENERNYGVYPSPVVLAPSIVGNSFPAKILSFALASPASAVVSVLLLSVTANIVLTATIDTKA